MKAMSSEELPDDSGELDDEEAELERSWTARFAHGP
jgi:hypothetical protein